MPHAVQEADERRCQLWVAGRQLRQQVAAPADLLEEGKERDDHYVDREVNRGIRLKLPRHCSDYGRRPVRRESTAAGARRASGQYLKPARCKPSCAQPALWYPSGVITRSISSTPAVTVSMLRIWIASVPVGPNSATSTAMPSVIK